METRALSHRPLPSGFRSTFLSSHPSVYRTVSIATSKTSHVLRTLKCSTFAPSLGDQSVRFKEAAKDGNLVPLYRSIFSDHLTPVLAYRCLVKEDDREAPSFLFESVEPGLKASSVVSFISPPFSIGQIVHTNWGT